MDEGYIKFNLHWDQVDLPPGIDYTDLHSSRQLMYDHHFIGWDETLNVGFGNISKRYEAESGSFIISGTQTGGLQSLGKEHYCLVNNFEVETNQLWCQGPIKASSESMTHAAIYSLSSQFQAVIHIHHQGMWEYFFNKLPTTDPSAAYGTPAMAKAIIGLGKQGFSTSNPLVIMGGHQDGILAFGTNLATVAKTIMVHYATLN